MPQALCAAYGWLTDRVLFSMHTSDEGRVQLHDDGRQEVASIRMRDMASSEVMAVQRCDARTQNNSPQDVTHSILPQKF
jgi:hypothetical protein